MLLPVDAVEKPDGWLCNLLLSSNSVVFIQHDARVAFAEHQHTCLNSTP
jgi:cell division protein FtsL